MALYVDIKKKCGDFNLRVNFEMDNEVFAILGASGCGKSMTLKCIAGIETPDEGLIKLNGRVLFDSQKKINVPARKRHIGYLFQDYALFPNMNVFHNVFCGAKNKKVTEEYIDKFLLTELEKLYPSQLSGGQKQRVALARMLSGKPELVMFDEPFSAVDSHMKAVLEREVLKVFEDYGKNALFVSHDRNEVYRLTDRIAVMENGQVVDIQTKKELFDAPRTLAATLLSGCKNVSHIEMVHTAEGMTIGTTANSAAADTSFAIQTSDDMAKQNCCTFYAKDWEIELEAVVPYLEKSISEYSYAGIRAHYFELTDKEEFERGIPNVMECKLEQAVEDIFSTTIHFFNHNGTKKNRENIMTYELSKEAWERLKNEMDGKLFYLKYPSDKIMLMKQDVIK